MLGDRRGTMASATVSPDSVELESVRNVPIDVSGEDQPAYDSQDPATSPQDTASAASAASGNEDEEGRTTPPESRRNSLGAADYHKYSQLLSSSWDDIPLLNVTFKDLNYTIQVPKDDLSVPNMAKETVKFLQLPYRILRQRSSMFDTLYALRGITGSLKPGRMTLVLAPPGAGKSALLRALAGHLNRQPGLGGEIRYNGLTKDECQKAGWRIDKLAAYCGQTDVHMPTLTVRETLAFALENAVVDPKHLNNEELNLLHRRKLDLIIDLLNLNECQKTIVGNDLLRGISGGQKKRLTIGEMIITNARLLCLDEITNGLDAGVAFDINEALGKWTKATKATVITALLQPTPETYSLFDDVLLLRDGQVLYHGPREPLPGYLNALGVYKLEKGVDDADWIVDFLSNPDKYMTEREESESSSNIKKVASNNGLTTTKSASTLNPIDTQDSPRKLTSSMHGELRKWMDATALLSTTESMATAWSQTRWHQNMVVEASTPKNTMPTTMSDYSHKQYGTKYTHSFSYHVWSNIVRQVRVISRDCTAWAPRFMVAIIMGLLLGGLFYQIPQSDYGDRVGLILFVIVNSAFSNMAELPSTDAAKPVLYKQMDHRFFPAASFIIAQILIYLPVQFLEVEIVGSAVYFMTGFSLDAGRYFFFILSVFLTNLLISVWFRSISYSTQNQFIAQQIDGPAIGVSMLFGGFLITRPLVPNWLIEFYYLSPFSWVVQSVALSEYNDPRYNNLVNGVRAGDSYLEVWGMRTDDAWKWSGIGYLAGMFLVGTAVCAYALQRNRFDPSIGTKRLSDEEQQMIRGTSAVQLDRAATESAARSLPFIATTLTWQNISYDVPIKGEDDRRLLSDVSGFCKPGEMTALMGASGAGKTTLMDVLAGRKTAGKMEGHILLNGYPKDDKTFSHVAGYAEQQDLHMGFSTVKESLLFSAKLRLPVSVTVEQRAAFVGELLELLELQPIADRVIGDESYAGLSPAQKKLVTIGVELASNPAIMFLDEPTSGLDSRAALVVMRVVRRIAATGRTVLCTIHQPSAEIFYLFDRLLLLKPGGTVSYLGPVGKRGKNLINYMENVSPESGYKCPPAMNPASWMIDVIADRSIDFSTAYTKSEAQQHNLRELEDLSKPKLERQESFMVTEARPNFFIQFKEVMLRENLQYWRNVGFNWTRAATQVALGIIFGLVFLNLSVDSFGGVASLKGGIFMAAGFAAVLNCSTVMPVVAAERAVFYRERSSGMYSAWAYGFSLMLVEVPHVVVGAFLYTVPFYFLMGLRADAGVFFLYMVIQILFSFIANAIGHFLAAALPNIIAATQVQGLIFTILFLFGGVFISPTSLPAGWLWLYKIDPYPHALNELILGQTANMNQVISVLNSDGTTTQSSVRDYTSSSLAAGYNSYGENVGWLFLELLVWRAGALLALRYISHIKR